MIEFVSQRINHHLAYVLMVKIIFLLMITVMPGLAHAYPEFIGYRYSSCVTCHFNGQGNGPLNDYGRAVWASEIAGRAFSGNKTADQLGESSGFLGRTELPWWIRPGVKARQLLYRSSPGGRGTDRSITMQAEGNLALIFKEDQSLMFVGSYGYVPVPNRLANTPDASETKTWISREHYLRWQTTENLWTYVGMMDKVYGIRIVDHTAYSRAETSIAMNDQTHGVLLHYIKPEWELSFQGIGGNMFQESDLRQVGASMMFEYELQQASRIGFSVLSTSNKYIGETRVGLHTKSGFGDGAALMFEGGYLSDKPKTADGTTGYYIYAEAFQKMFRGYHMFFTGQAFKKNFGEGADLVKMSGGFLMFPMARSELRIEVENARSLQTSGEVTPETWIFLAQLHLSL